MAEVGALRRCNAARPTAVGHNGTVLTTIIECVDIDAELMFFRRLDVLDVHLVSPADDPTRVVLHGSAGAALELRRAVVDRPVALTFSSQRDDALELVSPGGSTVTLLPLVSHGDQTVGAMMRVPVNDASLTIVEPNDGDFGFGRAGMEYRDLLPDRWGGRFIASHIRITDGGDVDDWVHFHRIRFQMIYVAAGWVDVVYEGQGDPFRMVAGDCVLQPPEIRHRVLRSSPGLEVLEIGCPAEHDTIADHELALPTAHLDEQRDFSGQRFVRHIAAGASLEPWVDPTIAVRDTGIASATEGLAGAVVVSGGSQSPTSMLTHAGEFVMIVGLSGAAMLDLEGQEIRLAVRTSVAIPAGTSWSWSMRGSDHEALVVSMPSNTIELV